MQRLPSPARHYPIYPGAPSLAPQVLQLLHQQLNANGARFAEIRGDTTPRNRTAGTCNEYSDCQHGKSYEILRPCYDERGSLRAYEDMLPHWANEGMLRFRTLSTMFTATAGLLFLATISILVAGWLFSDPISRLGAVSIARAKSSASPGR